MNDPSPGYRLQGLRLVVLVLGGIALSFGLLALMNNFHAGSVPRWTPFQTAVVVGLSACSGHPFGENWDVGARATFLFWVTLLGIPALVLLALDKAVIGINKILRKQLSSAPREILKRYEKWKDIAMLSGPPGLRLIRGFNDEALSGE